jgi:thiol-disulfide isomerase/thioredoxin
MKRLLLFFYSLLFVNSIAECQPNPLAAKKILTNAFAKAANEHKNVLVIFSASWCGWCKKMDASLDDESCKKYFDKSYVIVHLTVDERNEMQYLENAGAKQFRANFHGEQAGLPFWLILDKNGNLLGDSFIRKDGQTADEAGENIGCPSTEKEVGIFIALVKRTSLLEEAELSIIAKRFSRNALNTR